MFLALTLYGASKIIITVYRETTGKIHSVKLEELFKTTIQTRALRREIVKELKLNDLSYGEFEILYLLRDNHPLQPSVIVAELNQEPWTVSRMISSLQDKFLISYYNNTEDKRRVFVSITMEGEEKVQNLLSRYNNKPIS